MTDPPGVTVDSTGDVYVVESMRIDKFDSSGNFLRMWGKDVASSGPGDTGTGFEICVPANGDTCKAATNPGIPGAVSGELAIADQAGTDASDNVYVVDVGTNRINKYDSSGNFLRAWGKDVVTAGPGNTGTGFEICVAANGDTCKNGATGSLGGEMSAPEGVGVDTAGNVYVGEFTNQRVQKFDSSGNFLRAWGKDVASAGPGNTGTGFEICVAANGDTCKAGVAGGLGGEFDLPVGAASDSSDNVYIADANNYRIDKFDSSGNFLRAWGGDVVSAGPGNTGTGFEICVPANGDTCKAGSPGDAGGESGSPRAIAVDAAGGLYATDGNNSRMEKFNTSGNFLLAWGKNVVSAGPGNTGTGFEICVAANGDTCKFGEDGGLGGEMRAAEGVGATSSGEVYVADETNERIQEFTDAPPSPPAGSTPAPTPTAVSTVTGQRAAAKRRCKKKFPKGPRRTKCLKKAKKLPV
jgi:NHL repeat-containing protein